MSQTNLYLYRTGDYSSPSEAYSNGALYVLNVDLHSEHISTVAGFDLYDVLNTIEVTASMFGFKPEEYEVVTMIDKRFMSLDEYLEEYGNDD